MTRSVTIEILEPAERRLIRRYGSILQRHPRLTESEKIQALLRRHTDPQARRALIRHYLPRVFEWARRSREGAFLARIEAGNRALIAAIDREDLQPVDDLDLILWRRVRRSLCHRFRSKAS